MSLIYPIERPSIPSGEVYHFDTDSGFKYEIRFGKVADDFRCRIVNFNIINEDFEEYSVVNRGEIFKVLKTVIEIIKIYNNQNTHAAKYRFSGEYKENDKHLKTSKRTAVFYNFAKKNLSPEWKISLSDNTIEVFS